ncbi:hypothetical protein ACF8MD_24900, partial [Pseudomonas sp. zjy_8]
GACSCGGSRLKRRLQVVSGPVGAASAAMLFADRGDPGLHPGYAASRPRPSMRAPFQAQLSAGLTHLACALENSEISSMSSAVAPSADDILHVNDSCQFADKQL